MSSAGTCTSLRLSVMRPGSAPRAALVLPQREVVVPQRHQQPQGRDLREQLQARGQGQDGAPIGSNA